ncbi:enolase C-terminal domain-like protein [Sphingomonas sediminicola]|uniref:enolase C-terminal domain-like protein n=1 Tax=Sphingomonas sediminicola TaxID=386874 RepID=UPI0024838687|nr:enolase C-terminal domain-like protein [Sphingomonas sediminicola]
MGLALAYRIETHRLAARSGSPATCSRLRSWSSSSSQTGSIGAGEAGGVYYLGDQAPQIVEALEANRSAIEACESREELRQILPIGGARNAVDCALWELEANRSGIAAYRLAGIEVPRPLITTFTLGADDPAKMAEGARRYADARAIKLKLTGELSLDINRVAAVRDARPDVWLGVDANQGFGVGQLDALVAAMGEQRVSLIEQPIARGAKPIWRASRARFRSPRTRACSASRTFWASSAASRWSTSSSTSAGALPRRC